jgi:uncharacterized protein
MCNRFVYVVAIYNLNTRVIKTMSDQNLINIEVAYATPELQKVLALEVPLGTSVFDGARMSSISAIFPEIDLDTAPLGIFGKAVKKAKTVLLKDGDRIEIYRKLIIDPKAARQNRAAKKDAK